MRTVSIRIASVATIMLMIAVTSASAAKIVQVGQTDDFQDGTMMGWEGGALRSVVGGGPTGAEDKYLRVDSDMFHLGTQNHTQWGGNKWAGETPADYLTNDITAISMDVCNFGPEPIALRILFTPVLSSRHATRKIYLEPNSGWQHVMFGILPDELERAEGTGSAETVRNQVNRIVIHHDPAEIPTGHDGSETINAVMGLDNITALGTRHAGDANLDGKVDLDDFVILKRNFDSSSTTSTWFDADFVGDGNVDLNDFLILRNHFGWSASVPEPATLTLLAFGATGLVRIRRR